MPQPSDPPLAFASPPLPTTSNVPTPRRTLAPTCRQPPVPRRARALRRAGLAARQNVDQTLTRYRYGAGAAFAGLRQRAGPHALELVGVVKGVVGDLERGMAGAGGHGAGWGGQGGDDWGGWGHGGDGEGDEDIPSWGAAPGVHVVLRGRCDEAYRSAVAGLLGAAGLRGREALVKAFGASDPNVPLVILLSWMGANPRGLAKYKAFYEARGCEVHVVMNGLKTAIFPPASQRQAQYIADVIDVQHAERPVFVHAFSIGTGIYGLLLDKLVKEGGEKLDGLRSRLAGVVFDSGPAPIFPHDVAKGLHTVCPPVPKPVWEAAARAFFFVTQARKAFEKGEKALAEVQHAAAPQLYFYSKDDKVIPGLGDAVEGFIEENKRRGVEVYKTFWERSVHATHLKMHPKDYVGNLDAFVKRCMTVFDGRKGAAALASK